MTEHVFIDFYDEETQKWYTEGPNDGRRTIHEYRDYTKNGKQFIYPKSAKDSWDMGYKGMREFKESVAAFFKSNPVT